jgi:hypothetical protein
MLDDYNLLLAIKVSSAVFGTAMILIAGISLWARSRDGKS